ncbi:MAG TPA: helix-turn-helix domain-containing protein [Gemmatimonadales bacterium]|nr:helix-turn-helix domain-containing protein [Gemmatimonadales bacterium]
MSDSVLLIDADAEELRILGEHLDGMGYDVGRYGTGEAGLAAFDRLRPDVVILGHHLRDIDGLEVLEDLRERGGAVIFLTERRDGGDGEDGGNPGNGGEGEGDTTVRAMQLGAEHVVHRPVDVDHVAAATARVCEKVRLARQNALLHEQLERLQPAQPEAEGGDLPHQPQALAEVERAHIEKTLRFHGGNRTRAAHELGISRATLINKIKSYRLDI